MSLGHRCQRGGALAFLGLGALFSAVAITGCGPRVGGEHQLIVTGSTTILPIASIAAEDFQRANPDEKVLVSGVGSSAGIESVSQGTSDIGTSSRDLKPEEEAFGLVDTPIAHDAIAVIVNPENRVDGLTTGQLRDIFRGVLTNWSEVGGADLRIALVNRDEASGTREAFRKIVMNDHPFEPRAVILPGTGQVRSVVAQTPGAIGYISLGFVNKEVKGLRVDGVEPSPDTVADGVYPISRLLHYFTKGEPSGLAAEYIDYVLSDEVQLGAVTDAGFIPITARGTFGGAEADE